MAAPSDETKRANAPQVLVTPDTYGDHEESLENAYEANRELVGPVDGDVDDWAD